MLVVLLLGILAIVASGIGLFLARRSGPPRPSAARPPAGNPRQNELTDLFASRLRSGEIGIPDLIRLLRREGRNPKDISQALQDAMSRFPQLASRKDKLETWLREAE